MSGHHYARDLRIAEPQNSLRRLAEWIPERATVLELGPASGYFTRHLTEALGCVVDAVELNPAMAEQARPWCRKLVVGSLEGMDLLAHFAPAAYQCIIAADVIEHLRSPETVLRALKPLLAPEGVLLISVPNVAYAGLIGALLNGEFSYRDEGLLDRTHLRFFTRSSLDALLREGGFFAREWAAIFRPLNESEFKIRLENLPTGLQEALCASPHALCYQWLVRAGVTPVDPPAELPNPCREDAFPVRTFFHDAVDGQARERNTVVWGRIGAERQLLTIPVPEMWNGRIRVNLADRAGYVRLFAIRLFDDQGATRWQWSAHEGTAALTQSFDIMHFAPGDGYLLAVLHRVASWFVLRDMALTMPGGRLELDIGWPMSADYVAARDGLESVAAPLREALETALQEVAALRRQLAAVADVAAAQPTGEAAGAGKRELSWRSGFARWFGHKR